MKDIIFEWDPHKAEINIKKHGISFAEASTVFADEMPLYLMIPITRLMSNERLFWALETYPQETSSALALGSSRAMKI